MFPLYAFKEQLALEVNKETRRRRPQVSGAPVVMQIHCHTITQNIQHLAFFNQV
jgi:hypothetical protein